MKTKLFTVVLLFIFSLFSCSSDDSNNDRTNEVNLRLSNNSDIKFENATFNDVNFGDIEPGKKTEYKVFQNQYRYGKVMITIDGNDYGFQPIDFVGESLLEDGSYTHKYSFDNSTKTLTQELIKD